MSSSFFTFLTDTGKVLGNAGCVWMRVKTVFSIIVFIPILCVALYFLSVTQTHDTYIVDATVQERTSANWAKVSYIDPKTNSLVTTNVDISSRQNDPTLVKDSTLTLFVDKTNPAYISVTQPFTKTVKVLIMLVLTLVILSLCYSALASFYDKTVCRILGGADLLGDAADAAF